MDGYQFFSALFQSVVSLAWPAAIFGCVYLFREKLKELLPLLRLKHKDFEASFRLDKAEEEAAALPVAAEVAVEQKETPEEVERFDQLATVSPRSAIQEVRRELEYAIWNLAVTKADVNNKSPSLLMATRALRNKGIIGSQSSALLDDLRAIGNKAAHGGDEQTFTKEEAIRFRALADRAIKEATAEASGER
jgi:hypothetical protein